MGEVQGLQGYFQAIGMCGQGYMLGPGLAFYLRQLITGTLSEEGRGLLDRLSLYRDFGSKEMLK